MRTVEPTRTPAELLPHAQWVGSRHPRVGVLVLCAALSGPWLTACGTDTDTRAEVCDNFTDDDGDCADEDCLGQCPEICGDDLDNDGDGEADCRDSDCVCPEDCSDGRDNDGDGEVDCDDADCVGQCPEDCGDGVDNDGDGATDCRDPDCDGGCVEDCADERDNDGDGAVDCDDRDCDGACAERCLDGFDNDGDGAIDCADTDCLLPCDSDEDGFLDALGGGSDCDDASAAIHPDAVEVCNGVDDDCDGLADEADPGLDAMTREPLLADLDEDGWGDDAVFLGLGCAGTPGTASSGGDCADHDPARYPGAAERCTGTDDDCDGLVDDADPDVDPTSGATWFADADADGYGDPLDAIDACLPPSGYVGNDLDCDPEDSEATVSTDWWADGDGDGQGAGASVATGCVGPPGAVSNADDCDDSDDSVHAGPWYQDADGDGAGDPLSRVVACPAPAGFVDNGGDCDDGDPSAHLASVWASDADGDGFGDPLSSWVGCDPGPGFSRDATDCDDGNSHVYPGGIDVLDGLDNDCNGWADDMADADADALADGLEAAAGTDPLDPDTDGDSLPDGTEIHTLGTDPLSPDGGACLDLVPAPVTSSLGDVERLDTLDLDADGDLDLVVADSEAYEVASIENLGVAGWGAPRTLAAGSRFVDVVAEDLTGTGLPDVAMGASSGTVSWVTHLGSGLGFGPELVLDTTLGQLSDLDAADLDGDGDPDLMFAVTSRVGWFENRLIGFGPARTLKSGGQPTATHAEDVDGDGDLDVIYVSEGRDEVRWVPNLGGGAFGPARLISGGLQNPTDVTTADLDGDGAPDVVVSTIQAGLRWYRNEGGGGFSAVQTIALSPPLAFFGTEQVAAGDLDGDGDADVAVTDAQVPRVVWWENTGSAWLEHIVDEGTTRPTGLVLEDMHADGDADLVVAFGGRGTVDVFENLNSDDDDADGLGAGAEVCEVGTDPLAADSDGDGLGDLDELLLLTRPDDAADPGVP